jgi:hypothetical protein
MPRSPVDSKNCPPVESDNKAVNGLWLRGPGPYNAWPRAIRWACDAILRCPSSISAGVRELPSGRGAARGARAVSSVVLSLARSSTMRRAAT